MTGHLCATQLTGTFVAHNINYSRILFLKSARRHRIGNSHTKYVIAKYIPFSEEIINEITIQYKWIGKDQKDRELEILADLNLNTLIVFHVMPTIYRRSRND